METSIALNTFRLPRLANKSVTAIIKIDQSRAQELLNLMREITIKAEQSSHTFKISSFESNALYVPSHALLEQPAPNDFLVLPEDFIVTDTTPVKMIHADVMPFQVVWEAYDPAENYKLTTASLEAFTLQIIARGIHLPPLSNRLTIQRLSDSSGEIFSFTKKWINKH